LSASYTASDDSTPVAFKKTLNLFRSLPSIISSHHDFLLFANSSDALLHFLEPVYLCLFIPTCVHKNLQCFKVEFDLRRFFDDFNQPHITPRATVFTIENAIVYFTISIEIRARGYFNEPYSTTSITRIENITILKKT
jgi:hypothetical protein